MSASVFTSRVTKSVEIPNDPGQSATIRQLNPKALDRAAKAAQRASVESLKDFGGPAFLKEMSALGDKAPDTVKAAKQADPLLVFDRDELLKSGVLAWTYDEKVSPETLEDLNAETAEFLAREVLRLSKPALFEGAEVDEKNA